MEISLNTIKAAAEIIALVALVWGYFVKLIRFMDRQKEQDKEIKEIKAEQEVLTRGILACLKGLKEQGCNGPVTEAIETIEDHLNKKAHK